MPTLRFVGKNMYDGTLSYEALLLQKCNLITMATSHRGTNYSTLRRCLVLVEWGGGAPDPVLGRACCLGLLYSGL